MVVVYPTCAFFGEKAELAVSNFAAANEGSDPVVVSLVEVVPNTANIRSYDHANPAKEWRQVLNLPATELADNTYRFRLRLTDHLGQSSEIGRASCRERV